MGPILIIKSGTTSIQGSTVKGSFSYFSASTLDLGPTSTTGLYAGIDAPDGGYTVYQIGGPNGLNANVATNTTELNTILITAGATGSTLNDRIIWATNTNTIFINSGTTTSYYFGGSFTLTDFVVANLAISLNTDGSNDTSFNVGVGFSDNPNSFAIQSDGKILVGGDFFDFQNSSQNNLIRLNSNGSKDTSFNIGTGFDNYVESVAIQSDGKILVGGLFNGYQGDNNLKYFIRLNSDGSIDFDAFNGRCDGDVYSIAIQSDGYILVGGFFQSYDGYSSPGLVRVDNFLFQDFNFDIGTGFNSGVYSIAIQSDGKILVGGFFNFYQDLEQNYLIRLNSDGSKDTTFNIGSGFDNAVLSTAIQSDGKILVGGFFTTFTGATQNYLIRLNSDGSKDTTFNIGSGFDNAVLSTAIQSDGKILVGGFFNLYQDLEQNYLIRLNSDGSKDTSFNIGTGFNNAVYPIAVKSDGKILVGGDFTIFSGTSQNRVLKTLNYSLDTSFDVGTGFNGEVFSINVQSDLKVLVGGQYTTYKGSTQNYLIRLNTNGSKDTSFNIGTGFNTLIRSIAIQSDGKVLAGGDFTTFTGATQNRLIRLNSDGSKDTSFNIGTGFGPGSTSVFSIAIQSDGKILVGGNFTTFTGATQNRLIRLNSDGSKDTSFNIGSGFNFGPQSIAIQSDGKILVGGGFTTFTGSTQNSLIRLNSNGSKDTSFDVGTGFNNSVFTIAIQSDGKVLVGGFFTTYKGSTQNYLIRLNSDGSKDTSFNIGTGFDNQVRSISIQSDGKILVGGNFTTYQGVSSLKNILLNSDGSISNILLTFNDQVRSVAIQQ